MVWNRTALDTKQPRVIREDKNLIKKKKEKNSLLLQKIKGLRSLLMFVSVVR